MGKDKPIIVWMNGKKTRMNRNDDSLKKQSDSQLHQKYAAAAFEDTDDEEQIPALVRRHDTKDGDSFRPTGKFNVFKPLLIAILSALLIGTVMGVFMLNMFVDIDDSLAQQNNGIATSSIDGENTDKEDNENTPGISGTVAPIQAFVLQAGVFSGEQNASEMADSFKNAGFSAMLWQKDNQFYVFAGVASSEAEAKKLANQFSKADLDVYVKAWSTESFQLKMNGDAEKWMQQFQKQWQQAVGSLSSGESISMEDWNQLVEADLETTTEVGVFADQLDKELSAVSDNYWNKNIAMLQLWKDLSDLSAK
ncbi:SPOR domain-containing protein [Virgibacillus siamensis]|uniref:SPOR domain-containing protein n=1 Tax=Virgibacillus siamensis TaxID=480071 RepID=UPI000985AC50|nr:SPOR domain-containing protein [Virgibacillus siamensis]